MVLASQYRAGRAESGRRAGTGRIREILFGAARTGAGSEALFGGLSELSGGRTWTRTRFGLDPTSSYSSNESLHHRRSGALPGGRCGVGVDRVARRVVACSPRRGRCGERSWGGPDDYRRADDRMNYRLTRMSACWLVLVWVLAGVVSCGSASQLPELAAAPSFEMTDQHGESFDSRHLEGRVWVARFMFTSSPGC